MVTHYELGGCPACGSEQATEVADGDSLRDELEQLWSFHTRRLRGETPPERLHDRIAFSQDPPLRIARCDGCGLIYRNPRERAERLVDMYAGERAETEVLRSLFDNQRRSYRNQARRLTRLLGRTGTGLEVGSYVGAFLAAARDEGWSFHGVDVNPEANAFAASNGFDVATGSIDASSADRRYDVVAFWNCFDQLPDPRAAVRAARARLRESGLLALRVPNGEFYARWRTRLNSPLRPLARALLAHNNLLGFPYRHGFTTASTERLLASEGFSVVAVEGDVLVPLADEWTRGWARLEERLVKEVMRMGRAGAAPWFEVYARAP